MINLEKSEWIQLYVIHDLADFPRTNYRNEKTTFRGFQVIKIFVKNIRISPNNFSNFCQNLLIIQNVGMGPMPGHAECICVLSISQTADTGFTAAYTSPDNALTHSKISVPNVKRTHR